MSLVANRATVRLGPLARGRHTLVFTASDYQEAKNMEDVAAILPNTRVLRTTFTDQVAARDGAVAGAAKMAGWAGCGSPCLPALSSC